MTSTTAIFIDSNPNGARDGFGFSGGGLADRVADNSNELNETIIATGFAGITDLKVGPGRAPLRRLFRGWKDLCDLKRRHRAALDWLDRLA